MNRVSTRDGHQRDGHQRDEHQHDGYQHDERQHDGDESAENLCYTPCLFFAGVCVFFA